MDKKLLSDAEKVLRIISKTTGIKTIDIFNSSNRINGHVRARHAAFFIIRKKGYTLDSIAEAFKCTRSGVQLAIKRASTSKEVKEIIANAEAYENKAIG